MNGKDVVNFKLTKIIDVVLLRYIKQYKQTGNSYIIGLPKKIMENLDWKKGNNLIEEIIEIDGKKAILIRRMKDNGG